MSCMRVMLRKTSRNPSGAQTIVFWINCRATRLAATAVFRHAAKTRSDSTMPSRLRGVAVRWPAKAAWAAFCRDRARPIRSVAGIPQGYLLLGPRAQLILHVVENVGESAGARTRDLLIKSQ